MVLIDRLVLAIDDLFGHSEWVSGAERLCEGHKLVNDAAERPYVGLLRIGLRLDDLGAGVQDGANE